MKIRATIIAMLTIGSSMSAQTIIGTHPANPSTGKILTMEETIMSRELSPANLQCRWIDNENIFMRKDGEEIAFNIATRLEEKYKAEPVQEKVVMEGRSLYYNAGNDIRLTIAESESPEITYGQHVSRNEFGIEGGIFWAPDSSKVAFYRKDESLVTSFPLLDITTRTGSLKEIKYPMAGMDSERIQVGVYNLNLCKCIYLKVDDFGDDRYLTNISWTPDGTKILVQVLDRSQKHMRLNMYDAYTGVFIRTILTEDNDRYIEPQDPVWFVKGHDNLFIYRTDNRDGYRNLYLCDLKGNVRRLTSVDADVQYIANDGKYVWYTSAEVSPIENHLFRMSMSIPGSAIYKGVSVARFGKPKQLTTEEGWHTIQMSKDCRHYIDSWSSLNTPAMTNLCSSDGTVIRNMLSAEDPTRDYAYTEIVLGTIRSADGKYDNYYRLIKPKDFDPTKKYPTIVYVYGGPHSQMVRNTSGFTETLGDVYGTEGLCRLCAGQQGHFQQRRRIREGDPPSVRTGRDGRPDGRSEDAPQPPVCRCRPHWCPRMELRRIHDHIAHDQLSGDIQGGSGRWPGDRLEMVRGNVWRKIYGPS